MNRLARTIAAVGVAALLAGLAGCGDGKAESATPAETAASDAPGSGEHVTLRLGYFPNVTHATAIVGVESGIFADALGDDVTL